jgi:hypothetical protein
MEEYNEIRHGRLSFPALNGGACRAPGQAIFCFFGGVAK